MAGFYADVPGHRMAYDADGTSGAIINVTAGTITATLTSGNLAEINDEDSGVYTNNPPDNTHVACALIFPELRDIVGHKLQGTWGAPTDQGFWYSADTTNGLDGTWTQSGGANQTGFNATTLRTAITSVNLTGVKGLRWRLSYGGSNVIFQIACLHVYGYPSANTNRLQLWHPSSDIRLGEAALDFGDVYRGQTITSRQFRIKNLSATLTASTITISREANTDGGTQTTVAGLQFSDDNSTWGDTTSITSIAPGAISAVRYIKYAPTTSATLGLRWARVKATASSWA